jgi:hypothetical protein
VSDRLAPNIGALLAPLIEPLDGVERAVLIAAIERAAGNRYRVWAERAPRAASELLECVRREDDIAARAERLFPLDTTRRARVDALMPRVRELYANLFSGLTLREELTLQANAELQGAAAWRAIAATHGLPDAAQSELEELARLEEANAARLEKLIANWND